MNKKIRMVLNVSKDKETKHATFLGKEAPVAVGLEHPP